MSINFTIKGLAACYHKEENDFYNIIFPTDETHKVYFMTSKGGVANRIPLKGRRITVTVTKSIPPDEYEDSSFIKYAKDFTGDYLHSEGVKKKRIKSHGVEIVKLEIQHAKMFSAKEREGRLNYVFPINNPADITLIVDENGNPQIFSELIQGKIEVEEGGMLRILIDGVEPIDLSDGDSFYFDNDCHCETGRNDFQLYQDVFVNILSEGGQEILYQTVSIKDETVETFATISAAFRRTDPPPLDCDPVRISNLEYLED
jgi:hypothetical protein